MSRTVTIPTIGENPFVVQINGNTYSYIPGSTASVPDDVATVIDNINANLPKEKKPDGITGQVWTRKEDGSGVWADAPSIPSGGATGQFLKKTADGYEWSDLPTYNGD